MITLQAIDQSDGWISCAPGDNAVSSIAVKWLGTISMTAGWADIDGAADRTAGIINMSNTARDVFITGLRNAHAMEIQARELMERQSERLDEYPEVKAQMQSHLQETNEQVRRLEQCLDACGESSSSLKDTAQSAMANLQAMGHAMAGDEILKNTFANNAFEHFEIAAYKSLLALCGPAGVEQARAPLEASLKEEQRMADWVDAHVESVTMAYLQHEQRHAA